MVPLFTPHFPSSSLLSYTQLKIIFVNFEFNFEGNKKAPDLQSQNPIWKIRYVYLVVTDETLFMARPTPMEKLCQLPFSRVTAVTVGSFRQPVLDVSLTIQHVN